MVEGSIFVLPDLHTFYQTKSEQTNFFMFFFHKKKLLVLQNVVATAMMMEHVTSVTGTVVAKNMAWDI